MFENSSQQVFENQNNNSAFKSTDDDDDISDIFMRTPEEEKFEKSKYTDDDVVMSENPQTTDEKIKSFTEQHSKPKIDIKITNDQSDRHISPPKPVQTQMNLPRLNLPIIENPFANPLLMGLPITSTIPSTMQPPTRNPLMQNPPITSVNSAMSQATIQAMLQSAMQVPMQAPQQISSNISSPVGMGLGASPGIQMNRPIGQQQQQQLHNTSTVDSSMQLEEITEVSVQLQGSNRIYSCENPVSQPTQRTPNRFENLNDRMLQKSLCKPSQYDILSNPNTIQNIQRQTEITQIDLAELITNPEYTLLLKSVENSDQVCKSTDIKSLTDWRTKIEKQTMVTEMNNRMKDTNIHYNKNMIRSYEEAFVNALRVIQISETRIKELKNSNQKLINEVREQIHHQQLAKDMSAEILRVIEKHSKNQNI